MVLGFQDPRDDVVCNYVASKIARKTLHSFLCSPKRIWLFALNLLITFT